MTTTRTGRLVKPNQKYADAPKIVLNAPKQLPQPPKRDLDLDLSDVPVSQDPKFSKDWGAYNNEFWVKHFTTPDDIITSIYREATDKLGDLLPANFRLIKDIPSAFGVANLELKKDYSKPIKQIPSLSRLEKGEYQTAGSKSDKNISARIKFFLNNLPSFKQFKGIDDISWVINQDRILIAEILKKLR